jgi:deoxyribonuclease-4
MKIFLGPSGIPTISRINSSIEGIKTVAEIGLNAMEIEFVRGVHMSLKMAEECGEVAKQFNVKLSVHAPYYINLISENKETVEASKKRILDSMERASLMDAYITVVHAGYYGKLTKKEALEKMIEQAKNLVNEAKSSGWDNTSLGLETSGRIRSFGTVEEIVKLCEQVKGCGIALDAAHIFARQAGKIDYSEMFEKIKPLNLGHVHMHFSGIKWRPVKLTGTGNEWYHMEIKTNQPPFEPLAKEILKRKLDVTIICESPVLEQDSLIMKKVFKKLGYNF